MLISSVAELQSWHILAGIPHDAPAIFVYLLLAAFVGLIWAGSRSKEKGGDPARPPDGTDDSEDGGGRP